MYIVMSRRKKLYARLVCKLVKAPVMHSFIVYKDPFWGGWWAVEIDDKGVRICPFNSVRDNYDYLEFYKCIEGFENFLPLIKKHIGKSYDYLKLFINLGRLIIYKMFGKLIGKPFDRTSKLICTEFVTILLKKMGILGSHKLIPSLTAPNQLWVFLKNSDQLLLSADPTK